MTPKGMSCDGWPLIVVPPAWIMCARSRSSAGKFSFGAVSPSSAADCSGGSSRG
ncbi:hypothetical protein WMF45_49475 [Sorangium sp. So ce448]|uniref:hypothetical protein n=1 Tax=Sorangium sp. So ce448 TaxID=3133314 RepID=UPI003F62728F